MKPGNLVLSILTIMYIAPWGITGIRPGMPLSLVKASLALFWMTLMVSSKKDFGVFARMVGSAPWTKVFDPIILWDMQSRPFRTSWSNTLKKRACSQVGSLKEAYMASVIDDDPAHSPAWHQEPFGETPTREDRHLERGFIIEGKQKVGTVVVREAIGT